MEKTAQRPPGGGRLSEAKAAGGVTPAELAPCAVGQTAGSEKGKHGNMPEHIASQRPGRPRAIPEAALPRIMTMYREGLGYRAITRELAMEGPSPDWTTVRRAIKQQLRGGQVAPE